MANRVEIRPRARLDIVELATHIGKDSVLASNRFLDAAEKTFEFFAESPQIAAVYPTKTNDFVVFGWFECKDFRIILRFMWSAITGSKSYEFFMAHVISTPHYKMNCRATNVKTSGRRPCQQRRRCPKA